ncbi:AMP-binding protein [Streptomyces sp. NPDC001982]|uniref:AMP-binding protein n=1 Tax=Streptomyces sp. NPDC001982 TaxID=3154405 RepID=UPI00332E5F7D
MSAARAQQYVEAGIWNSSTLADRLAVAAAAKPDHLAVVDRDGHRVRTYAQLDRDVDAMANHLVELGVETGDVVAVQLPNWYETVVIDIAILRIGAVLNPMLPLYREHELAHMLNLAQTKVLFTPGVYRGFDFTAMIGRLRPKVPLLQHHIVIDAEDLSHERDALPASPSVRKPQFPSVDAARVSELIFTSGTEATPKAVMHTEQTTNSAVQAIWASLGLGDEVVWMPSPIGHSTGFNYGVRSAVYFGLTLVLQDKWVPEVALRVIEKRRCTFTLSATTFLSDLIAAADRLGGDLRSLSAFGSGGSPIPASIVNAAEAHGIKVLRLYGSTETLGATWNRPDSPLEKLVNTDGPPINGVDVEIRDDTGARVVDVPGEIFVRGPSTAVGFFADPTRTAETFSSDGWVATGDIGILGADGYLTVVGRKKEILIRGGLNIAPREIEDLMIELPAISAVAVIGIPDERLGELTCACVVWAPDTAPASLQEIVQDLTDRGVARYKLPQALATFDDLPMTPSGKIRKVELLDSVTAGRVPVVKVGSHARPPDETKREERL